MSDNDNTPTTPATPPADGSGAKEDWRKETFKARSERDAAEKQRIELEAKLAEANKQLSSTQSKEVELLRTKKAYAAGVPQHLLNLVTANDEAGIDTQIKSIMDNLMPGEPSGDGSKPDPKDNPDGQADPPAGGDPPLPPPPPPSGKPEEGWMGKWHKKTPEEIMQEEERIFNDPNFKLS